MTSPAYELRTEAMNSTNWTESTEQTDLEGAKPPEGCVVLDTGRQGDFIPWDNPDNLFTRETEQAFDSAVALVVLPVFFLISVPTNALNIIVFYKHGIQQRINLCLFCLSIVDFFFMLYSGVYNFDTFYQKFDKSAPKFSAFFEFIINNHLGVFRGLSWVSASITAVIACERCFCVLSPLRSQTIFRTRTTAIVIAVSSLVIVGILFITTTRWSIVCVFDPLTKATSQTMYSSKFYINNKQFVDTVTGVVVLLILPVYFVTVVLVTTIVTIVKLTQMVKWREQTSSASMSPREMALTRTLIGTSALYLLCSVPSVVFGFVMLSVPDVSLHGRYSNTFKMGITVLEVCMYVNATSNFFIYCKMSSKYRETLREIFKCCVRQDVLGGQATKSESGLISNTTKSESAHSSQ